MQLESLYQEIILDHYRNPQNKGLREPFDAEVMHVNPTCGDEVTLRVALKDAGGDPVVADVSYDALGCSISQASASVMTEMIIGKTVREAMEISAEFLALMQSRGAAEPDEDVLGDAIAFAGVSRYPARIKCALLGWMAWKDATAQAMEVRTMTENMTADPADPAVTTEADPATPEGEGITAERTRDQEDVLEALRDVVDPELGINVVDLGLIYGVDVDAERIATIDMTLTSAACPLTDVIEDQAREALEGVVTDFRINWVWMPPWGPESITDDGREQLRALGFNI
jgi:nitrogen fixation NifU-like protein